MSQYEYSTEGRVSEGNGTAWFVGIVTTLALLAMGWLVFTAPVNTAPTISVPLASPTVLLSVDGGHGSGVYIGNGYVLTAGHVAAHGAPTLETGDVKAATTVLWLNAEYDVALLHTDAKGIAAAPLACAPLSVGQVLRSEGNPMDLRNVSTNVVVAGVERPYGPWHNIVPVDGAIAPGMSGGPTYNADGRVAGLNVGAMIVPVGMGSTVGINYIVPASTVCELLATSANIID